MRDDVEVKFRRLYNGIDTRDTTPTNMKQNKINSGVCLNLASIIRRASSFLPPTFTTFPFFSTSEKAKRTSSYNQSKHRFYDAQTSPYFATLTLSASVLRHFNLVGWPRN